MFKSPSIGWQLKARMLRLFNDYYDGPFGMGSQSQHTRESTLYIADVVRTEIAQDRGLVWC